MGYVPDEVLAQLRTSHSLGIFIRLETDPALHLWLGVNDIPIKMGIESTDPDGTVYIGAGVLIGVPELEVLINGIADRQDFTLDGLSAANIAQIEADAPETQGAAFHVGITTLDDRYQPVSNIIPLWPGEADVWSSAQPAVSGTQTPTRSVTLTVSSGEVTRSRASRSHWTPPQQKALSPTDLFCDNVARLARGVQPPFPRF